MYSIILMVIYIIILSMFAYWLLLAVASLQKKDTYPVASRQFQFVVVIPAKDEAVVIRETIEYLQKSNYPKELIDAYVLLDHCTDQTADIAESLGVKTIEINDETIQDKGGAINSILPKIINIDNHYESLVIIDADTILDEKFFSTMNTSLNSGAVVVQGKHVIRNNYKYWYPTLAWAMLIIDNRYQNQGRVNLKLSAKNMGDSICIRSTVFSQINLDAGLTEDYTFRQKLLKMGIKIDYNPTAIGRGEAPISWKAAQSQRIRWLRGTYLANRGHSYSLLIEGLSRRDKAIVDGAIQGIIPSYSTITLISIIFCLLSWLTQSWLPSWLPILWTLLIISLLCYPFPALIIERAPLKAYLVILTGPVFIIWRTWLSIKARYFQKDERWIRTPRVEEAETKS